MRRHLRARLLVVAGLVELLVGMSVGPSEFVGYDMHATLTLWYPAKCAEATTFPTLARRCEQSHPGLRVREVAVPATTLEARLAAARAARNGPNVVITDDIYIATDCAASQVRDLSSRVSSSDLGDFLPAALAYASTAAGSMVCR